MSNDVSSIKRSENPVPVMPAYNAFDYILVYPCIDVVASFSIEYGGIHAGIGSFEKVCARVVCLSILRFGRGGGDWS